MKVNTGMYKSPHNRLLIPQPQLYEQKRYHVPVNCKHVSVIYNAIQNAKQYKCANEKKKLFTNGQTHVQKSAAATAAKKCNDTSIKAHERKVKLP